MRRVPILLLFDKAAISKTPRHSRGRERLLSQLFFPAIASPLGCSIAPRIYPAFALKTISRSLSLVLTGRGSGLCSARTESIFSLARSTRLFPPLESQFA